MTRSNKHLTDLKHADKFQDIVTLYNQSPRLTRKQIAELLNIPFITFTSILRTLLARNVIAPRSGTGRYVQTEAQITKARKIAHMHYNEGKSLSEIGRHLGLTRQAIYQFALRNISSWPRAKRGDWVNELITLYEGGTTRRVDLAKRLGKSRATISVAIQQLIGEGVLKPKKPNYGPKPEVMAKVYRIHALRASGLPWTQIAKEFNLNDYHGLLRLYKKHKGGLKG
jgi:DNA-binding transcriptional regulator LsrR (DeoR family)